MAVALEKANAPELVVFGGIVITTITVTICSGVLMAYFAARRLRRLDVRVALAAPFAGHDLVTISYCVDKAGRKSVLPAILCAEDSDGTYLLCCVHPELCSQSMFRQAPKTVTPWDNYPITSSLVAEISKALDPNGIAVKHCASFGLHF
jgi:hypothetical protein